MQLYYRSNFTLAPLCCYLICAAVHGPNRWCKCISLGKLPADANQCTELSNKQDKVQPVLDVLSFYSLAEFWPLSDVGGKKRHSITKLYGSLCQHIHVRGGRWRQTWPDVCTHRAHFTSCHSKKNVQQQTRPQNIRWLRLWLFYLDHHWGCCLASLATRFVIVLICHSFLTFLA